MLDDPAAVVRDLPGLRAYDRSDIEAFLAAAERREAELRLELIDARSRRAIAELSDAADATARQILLDAERDALAARQSLRELLDQLEASAEPEPDASIEPPVTEVRALSGWALQPTRGLPPWLRLPTAPMVAALS